MEKFFTKIVGTPVVEEGFVRALTTVEDIIVDPETGKMLAFVVNHRKRQIITTNDVLSWRETLKIHTQDSIIEVGEVLRIDTIFKEQVHIFRNNVETKKGKYLGKVYDFSIDSNTFMLQKLYVARGFLALMRYESRIIPAKNILEILPDKIVVKDDLAVVKEEAQQKVALEDMAFG